jgi:hypothetical protein
VFPNFYDWREMKRSFEEMTTAWRTNANLTGAGESRETSSSLRCQIECERIMGYDGRVYLSYVGFAGSAHAVPIT